MTQPVCPFCPPDEERVAFAQDEVIGLWDGFPVSPGHLLVIPKRHFPTWFEAAEQEHRAIIKGIETAKRTIEARHRPDGYNIGVNVGPAGGQTVPHLHVHVIPRYTGDVPHARGGIRHVIPGKGDYLDPARGAKADAHTNPKLITGGEDDPLLPYLIEQLATADQADIAVGFVQPSGVMKARLESSRRRFFSTSASMHLPNTT